MKLHTTFIALLAIAAFFISTTALALSPPNPTADISFNSGGNTGVAAIEAAFNNARRTEETQHGVTANALGNLDLPSQAVWDAMSASERALFLVNAERTARHNVNYPAHGTVLGLPLEGVESNLNMMAENYAEYMAANNFWAHTVPANVSAPPFAGTGSFSRISNHPVIGDGAGTNGGNCRQFLPYAENLHVSASSVMNSPTPSTLIEGAIYGWLYDDAGSAWGHRVAMLLQDQSLSLGSGFNNDRGSAASEGFMGIGFAGRGDGSYSVFDGTAFPSQWNVVWVVMDPAPDPGCNFVLLGGGGGGTPSAEVDIVSSCLAGNGRVDLNIVNNQTASAVYRFEFQGLSARQTTVAFEDWGRMPITGRPAGTYTAEVQRDGQTILTENLTINCNAMAPTVSTPEVTILNACRNNNGYVLFELVNPTASTRPYVIQFDGVPNRSTSAAPFGQTVRATTGRPDGTYNYLVRTGSTVIDTGSITVDCD